MVPCYFNSAIGELLDYGPQKPNSEQGYTEEQLESITKAESEKSEIPKRKIEMNGFTFYQTICPLGKRTGLGYLILIAEAGEDAKNLVNSTLVEANKIISKV